MPASKRTQKPVRGYSYYEYLKKYRPNPLPESHKSLPTVDDLSSKLAQEAVNKIKEGLAVKSKAN